MLHQFKGIESRSNQINQVIGKLVKERNKLLSLFVEDISPMPSSFSADADSREAWEAFGEQLVAYPCLGILGSYEKLEKLGSSKSINKPILAKIRETSGEIVEFHDRYFDRGPEDENDEILQDSRSDLAEQISTLFAGGSIPEEARTQLLKELSQDLSKLGITLEDYVALENRLLEKYSQYLKQTAQISPSVMLTNQADRLSERKTNKPKFSDFEDDHSRPNTPFNRPKAGG